MLDLLELLPPLLNLMWLLKQKMWMTLVEKLSPIGDLDNIRHVVEEEIEIDQGIKRWYFLF